MLLSQSQSSLKPERCIEVTHWGSNHSKFGMIHVCFAVEPEICEFMGNFSSKYLPVLSQQ